MTSTEYLDEERKKIWAKILELENLIEKKTSDYESEAKSASKKASEYRNKCADTKAEAQQLLEDLKKSHTSYTDVSEKLATISAATTALADGVRVIYDEITKKESLDSNIAELEVLFEKHDEFVEKIEALEGVHTSSEDLASKIEAIFKQLTSRKKEIDQLYYEIIGSVNVDPTTGKETKMTGLKKELQDSYAELKSKAALLQTRVARIEKVSEGKFESFSTEKEAQFTELIKKWTGDFDGVQKKITGLLPHALTAGLSYAYSEKKNAEIEESKKLRENFVYAIGGLIAVSLIPFIVSIVDLTRDVSLHDVILQMPRLVLAILPLYVPVLWIAYSANRRANLSKRLTEEYTHKEVLSKTFEGLAQQIQNIDDSEISRDLKTRLLYNILEVSSENPGKLISDYNKADHPLMDALEKSVQLGNAVEKISKIPGMTKLADFLEKRALSLLDSESKKADIGLEQVSEKLDKQDEKKIRVS